MKILETERLILRRATVEDGEFILELLNDPAWLRFIGDKGIRTLDAARDYISKTLVAMYERLGFGLYLTELKDGDVPIGVCGLIKRDSLEDVDVGFAFLPDIPWEGLRLRVGLRRDGVREKDFRPQTLGGYHLAGQ